MVNQGPQAGPLTPLFNGDLIQTPKGLRSLALEGFSEDLDQDGFVDPVSHAVASVAAPVQVASGPILSAYNNLYNNNLYANAAPAYNQVAYAAAPAVVAARALAAPSINQVAYAAPATVAAAPAYNQVAYAAAAPTNIAAFSSKQQLAHRHGAPYPCCCRSRAPAALARTTSSCGRCTHGLRRRFCDNPRGEGRARL